MTPVRLEPAAPRSRVNIWQNTRTSQFASSGYWKLILDRYFDRGTSADFRN